MTSGCNAQHRAHQPLCFLTSLGTLTFKVPVILRGRVRIMTSCHCEPGTRGAPSTPRLVNISLNSHTDAPLVQLLPHLGRGRS